jgi:ankyrin repeat protein
VLDTEYCSQNSSSVQLLAQQDSTGRTPLHLCAALPASGASFDIWVLLLHKRQWNAGGLQSALRQQDAAGRTVLHVLIELKEQAMLGELLRVSAKLGCAAGLAAGVNAQGVSAVVLARRIGYRPTLTKLRPYLSSEVRHAHIAFLNMQCSISHFHCCQQSEVPGTMVKFVCLSKSCEQKSFSNALS